jgi:hypothetical protein
VGERKGDEQRLCDLLAAFHIRLTRHRHKGQIALRLGFAEEARECTSSVVKIADLSDRHAGWAIAPWVR